MSVNDERQSKTAISRCADCGELVPNPHDCDRTREARALFEAGKRANSPDSRRRLIKAAYVKVCEAETVSNG